jgi:hypothetical protein
VTGTNADGGTATVAVSSSINFGAFDQGVMSVGGNVSITAGGNISDLAVSLPTTRLGGAGDVGSTSPTASVSTPALTVNTVGGGNPPSPPGVAIGLPTIIGPNTGALTMSNNVAGASQAAVQPPAPSSNNDRPSIIIVEVLGYGEDNGTGTTAGGYEISNAKMSVSRVTISSKIRRIAFKCWAQEISRSKRHNDLLMREES